MRTPLTPNWSSLLAAALAGAAVGARAAEVPSPEALLDAVLAAPAIPYQGRVMVTQWFGKQTRAEEIRVYVLPPDHVRREFLSPDGAVTRISVSDGDIENVRLVRSGKTVRGDAARSYDKVLPPEKERELLTANYKLSAGAGEKVAGRPTWKLTLEPKIPGKSWQTFWVDHETKVVLRSKRYQPRRSFASQSQFNSFEARKPLDESLFRLEASTADMIDARGMAPDFMTLEQLNKGTDDKVDLPATLPGGFVFESADAFTVGKRRVTHARYTDGLSILSLFRTDRPVRLPKGGVLAPGAVPLPGTLRASRAGKVLHWRAGPRHYTLMSDVSRDLLGDIAKALH
ncbi:MAG: hypothetical protein A2X37_10475 [Elusimicrobia bacterium GWA2_66_18]|nr:MAG: hypothetical protein A2X37_10475 [Elusimicrobia bacterium GWA2_66_18]